MSSGKSRDKTRSNSEAQSNSFIAPFQVPFLEQLGGDAAGLAASQGQQIGGAANALVGDLLPAGQDLLGSLSGIAGGAGGVGRAQSGLFDQAGQIGSLAAGLQGGQLPGNAILQSLAQGMGQQLLQPNPGLSGSISSLDAALQENLTSTLGTIAGQSTLVGGTGGSRQDLASGLAAQESQRQFAGGASSLISQDFATRQALLPAIQGSQLQAAGQLNQGAVQQTGLLAQLLGLEQQGLGQAGQLGGLQVGAAQGGLGALGGLFNLGLGGFGAEFAPLLSASQVVGSPTVLDQSSATSTSRGKGKSSSFGLI